MFSKPAEPRSIATQLVILFTLASTLMLGCGLGILYVIVVRHAFEEDNIFLFDKIQAVRGEMHKPDWQKAFAAELRTPRPNEHSAYWLRVMDERGNVIAETPAMNEVLPAQVFPAHHADAATLTPRDYRSGDRLFSLAATPHREAEGSYLIQIAQDRTSDEEFSRDFGALLIVVLVIGILASGLIAVTVTKRGLQPLTRMTDSLERVGPTHLTERLLPAGWPRELRPMAAAFDEMLNRLEDSFTRLSQFSADLAHELRTPVANMLGEAEVTLTRVRTPEEYREVVESNAAECQRLSSIIDNLLFLARAEAGSGAVQRTTFDGRAEIEKIATYYEAVAEEKHVTIQREGSGQVWADAMLFARALSNLIENALRYAPNGEQVKVALRTDEREATVAVSNNGVSIDAHHIPRLFDRFYRIDPARSPQGAGLGLAMVRSIMHLHGGEATVTSEPERGTTFTLTFPAKPKPSANS